MRTLPSLFFCLLTLIGISACQSKEQLAPDTAPQGGDAPVQPDPGPDPEHFGPVDGVWHITTAEELLEWNASTERWNAGDVVSIEANIDLQNTPWTPSDGFSGTFEGNGKCISHINVSLSGATARTAGFFGMNTRGTIRNIAFGSSDGTAYDGSSAIKMVSTYSADYSYMGLVAQGSPKMSNVVSFIPMALNDGSLNCRIRMGGLLGEAANGTTLEDCTMNAETSLNSGTGSPHSLGGLIGYVSGNTTVSGCANKGAVTSWCPYCLDMGGLVGTHQSGVNLRLEDSTNNGTLKAYDWQTASTAGYLGGIIGRGHQGLVLRFCVNNANVSAETERTLRWRTGGIVGQVDGVDVYACTNTGTVTGTNRLTGALIGMMGQGASHHGCEVRGKVVTPAATATLSFTNCSLWARGGNDGGKDGDTYFNSARACFRAAYCAYTSALNTQTALSDAKLGMLDVAYYAYIVPQADGSLNFNGMSESYIQGFVNRCHNAGVKVLLTFYSYDMAAIVANVDTRTALINNLCSTVEKYNFDGVDNDWETPKTSDGSHLTNEVFMQTLAARLGPEGRYTTAAITPGKYAGGIRDAITDNTIIACDWFNIMIYDDYSTATPGYNHSSIELFNTSYNYWVGQRGMPASKFISGLPNYGRPSGCAQAATLCIPLRTIVANGGSVDANSADNIPYNGAYYTILYNGRPTIKAKVDLCVQRRYGGYFFWEVGEDYRPASGAFEELNKSLVYYAGNYLKTTYGR